MRGLTSFLSLLTASSFLTLAFAHSPNNSARQNNAVAPLPITGVPGDVQPRLEIRQMASDEPTMFFLFVTAMQKFKENKDAISGYYAIAGIHGVPSVDWDGVEQCKDCDGATGYCTHNSVLFPAWHRAYVALLEQELYKIVQEVAAQYPNNANITDAAHRIRFPFWDWASIPAANTPTLPNLITDQQVSITGPDGTQLVDNPLFRYDFSDASVLQFDPFKSWNHTLRHPSSNALDALSDEVDVIGVFDQQRPSLQDQVYQLLSTCDDYAEFSNDDGSSSSPKCANSLESIHNLVHSYMGGPQSNISAGHMTYLPLAAFDPAFWLHHANVDRLFAMWQVLHSDSYGASQVAAHSTWTIAANTTQDANSPLKPFYKNSNGEFWTTNDVRDWEATFKYTYPGFTQADRQSNMAKLVNALYGPDAVYVQPVNSNAPPTSTSSIASFSAIPLTKFTTTSASTITATASTDVTFSALPLSTLTTSSISIAIPTTKPSVPIPTIGLGHGSGFDLGDLSPTHIIGEIEDGVNNLVSGIANVFRPQPTNGQPKNPFAKLMDLAGLLIPDMIVPKPQKEFVNINGSLIQYVANIRYPRWALDGSYTIYLFNGQPVNESPISFMTAKNLIGIASALAGGNMPMGDSISSSSVPLTRALQDLVRNNTIPDMQQDTVLPFLKQNLNWRIVGRQGKFVNESSLPGFQVSCYSTTSNQNSTTELPKFTKFVAQPAVTDEKPGGATNETIIKDTTNYDAKKQETKCSLPLVTVYTTVTLPPSTAAPTHSKTEACGLVTEYTTVTLAPGGSYPTGSY